MKYAYTAVLSLEPGTKETYNVSFPDLPGCHTFGESLSDAVDMAQDALCLWLYHHEKEQKAVPAATMPSRVELHGDDFTSVVSVDTEYYRRFHDNKLIKKTLNIPVWLNEQAECANVNFSQLLQKAIKAELHISE
ncbi:MAG: type II toxin-antitoxin system HicB family antitoxin [Oscillospiraceae bacterium]|jgi:predicted RNase H-like HicB family nuclease|nr:type II toxin-antitoxin system HicB family antitoxin [Oscillospiraceae bacterium]